MEIRRKDNTIIKKRKINFDNLEEYDELKMQEAIKFLNNEIDNTFVSHFDYISYFINNISSNFLTYNKNTGCVSSCKRLKKKLKSIGINSYYVSCTTKGFSNPAGDAFIKEAHMVLIYPSLKNRKIFFTIFDPGFRMKTPITFYDYQDSSEFPHLDGTAKVKYTNESEYYPYVILINKNTNYRNEIINTNIQWKFNPYYETININDYNKIIYRAIFSLKLQNLSKNEADYLCIRSKVLDKTLELYTPKCNEVFTFKQLSNFNIMQLKNIFEPHFTDAHISNKRLNQFVNNLFLLIHHADKYIENVIVPEVIENYRNGYEIDR